MGKWRGTCRSNYFKVTDPAAFRALLASFNATLLEKDGRYGFAATGDGSCPSQTDEASETERSLCREIHRHLAGGEVCIVMEVGWSDLDYLTGWARAIHSSGAMITLDLEDIYAHAAERFGSDQTITPVAD